MCVPQTGWNYIGNSTCLKTRQTVHNIHKLLRIWYKCKWCFAYLSFIWKWVLKANLIKKKKKKKNLPHLELKKKNLPHYELKIKKLSLPGWRKKNLVLTQTSCSPPLKSNGASLTSIYLKAITSYYAHILLIAMLLYFDHRIIQDSKLTKQKYVYI